MYFINIMFRYDVCSIKYIAKCRLHIFMNSCVYIFIVDLAIEICSIYMKNVFLCLGCACAARYMYTVVSLCVCVVSVCVSVPVCVECYSCSMINEGILVTFSWISICIHLQNNALFSS